MQSSSMSLRIGASLALLAMLIGSPALARVLAEGKPKGGFYWQKIEQQSGKTVYQYRSTKDSKFHKQQKCQSAGAVQPK
jgi:hypothetical protein